jgi:hypothetical protein
MSEGGYVDITVSLHMAETPPIIAATMFDPTRDPLWIGGVVSIEILATRPTLRVRRHGTFMGRKFSWETEVRESEPNRRLVMRFLEGPMKGEVSYDIMPAIGGAQVSIRNHASARFWLPGIGWILRRSVQADLQRLKTIVEGGH